VLPLLPLLPDEPEVLVDVPPAIDEPEPAVVEPPELLPLLLEPPLLLLPLLLLPLDELLELPEVEDEELVDVLVLVVAKSDTAGFGIANVLCFPTASDWIWKSKSTPMNSKNVSLTVIYRTSTDTCRSWSRRS
jgi:hypothetical protein